MLLTRPELRARLALLNHPEAAQWEILDDQLCCELTFNDFRQAFHFMKQCAELAEDLNHHPDWRNAYNRVWISLTTHDAGGLTELDFLLAERINEVLLT